MEQENKKAALRVSYVSIVVNVVLSVFKLVAGLVAASGAMISDAVHSASDVFSTFVVIAGVSMASSPADEEHPYGHDRLESIAAILLAAVLAVTGFGIGATGIEKIKLGMAGQLQAPGFLALIAAIVSIAVKEWMFHYTKRTAKKIRSDALMADAWHHRSDAFSSIGSLIGIGGAMLGWPILDPIAALVICVLILKAAADIARDAVSKVTDRSCDPETVAKIAETVQKEPGVLRLDSLKTRMFGSKIYVDVEVSADGNMSLYDSHHIAVHIHRHIEENFPEVKHCMVHMNPYMEGKEPHNRLKERAADEVQNETDAEKQQGEEQSEE